MQSSVLPAASVTVKVTVYTPTALKLEKRRDDQPTLDLSTLSDVEEAELAQLSAELTFDEQLDALEKDIVLEAAKDTDTAKEDE